MSEKRIRASRLNGARSRGPKTPDGKRRSSQNATRHGLLAHYVVVPGEDPAAFQSLVDSHIAKFGAADDTERDLIEEMAAANWRQRRLWAIEASLFTEATQAQPPGGHLARLTGAFSTLADNGRLALLYRYETRLHLMYRRAYQNLLLMRNAPVPNEPNKPIDSNEPCPRDDSPVPAGRLAHSDPDPIPPPEVSPPPGRESHAAQLTDDRTADPAPAPVLNSPSTQVTLQGEESHSTPILCAARPNLPEIGPWITPPENRRVLAIALKPGCG